MHPFSLWHHAQLLRRQHVPLGRPAVIARLPTWPCWLQPLQTLGRHQTECYSPHFTEKPGEVMHRAKPRRKPGVCRAPVGLNVSWGTPGYAGCPQPFRTGSSVPAPAPGSGVCSACPCLSFPIDVMGLLMLHHAKCYHLVLAVAFCNPREQINCSAFSKKPLLFPFLVEPPPKKTREVESSPQHPQLSKLGKAGGKQRAWK